VSGNLPVTVTAADSAVSGQISGTFYVGDKPQGSFAVTPTSTFVGNQMVHGTLNVTGVDKAFTVDSPLIFAIDNAVELGSQYVATNVVADQNATHCLRCHVQSQSYYGLASLLGHDVGSNQTATQYIYNAFGSGQYDDGFVTGAYYTYRLTPTTLALWSLTQAPDKIGSFAVKYKAARYMEQYPTASGNAVSWYPDYNVGWWANNDTATMMVVKGYVDLLQTSQNNDLSSVNDYSPVVDSEGLGGATNAMRVGPDGALYALHWQSGTITRVDPSTGTLSAAASGLPINCEGLQPVSSTEFYVTCPGVLLHVMPDGTIQTVVGNLSSKIFDVLASSDGTLYLSDPDNNQILKGTPGGSFTTWVSGGLLNRPYGLRSVRTAACMWRTSVASTSSRSRQADKFPRLLMV